MAAILRASGSEFDVDAFITECDWRVAKVFRRGEALSPSRPASRKVEQSGMNVVVSEAGVDAFGRQLEDAIAFLKQHGISVGQLASLPSVQVSIDFAIARRHVAAQTDAFPAKLVRLAGTAGIGLELSQYPVSDGS